MNNEFSGYLTSYASNHDPEPAINREDWLNNALDIFVNAFREMNHKLPKEIRVSCGFPKGRSKAIGQVWSKINSRDNHFEIFISPEIAEPTRALDILIHEICHIAAGIDAGHKAAFKRFAVACGLEGKMTATTASGELVKILNLGVIPNLGKYPHAELTGSTTIKKKQTTRLKKLTCPSCGMVIRCTAKWLEDIGAPICFCDSSTQFEQDEAGE